MANLIKYRSAPVATISYYNHSLMLEKMNKQGFKVGLLGTAADEIFSGYYDHHLFYLRQIKNDKKLFKHKLHALEPYSTTKLYPQDIFGDNLFAGMIFSGIV